MEIFLMVLALSLVGTLVCGVLFVAATREVRHAAAGPVAETAAAERFFVMRADSRDAPSTASADLLALRIERHVRLEQVAAEYFSQCPSAEALHGRMLTPIAG